MAELRDVALQLLAQACREGGPSISVAFTAGEMRELDAADVQPERLCQADAELEVLAEAHGVAGLHGAADPGALARPPHRVRRELRQQPVRSVDELLVHLLREVLEQHALVRHAGAVMDAVVRGQAVADVFEHGPPRRPCDHPEPRDDQPLVEDLHQEDLLLERVGLERQVGKVVEVRIALGRASGLRDQLEPRLGVTRLVLHHRRVVELRLDVGRDVQQLRRHVAREHVRLQLLGQHRAPHVLAPRLALRRPFALRDRRELAPG